VSIYYFWSCNCGFVFCHDFFKKISGDGEMNKVHGKSIFTQIRVSIQKLSQEIFFCEEWGASFLARHKGEKKNSPIRTVNFCKTFCTCSPSSLGQDLMVKNSKSKFFFIWAS
jgi:hypothetical protein